jgi:hypothetical protein
VPKIGEITATTAIAMLFEVAHRWLASAGATSAPATLL